MGGLADLIRGTNTTGDPPPGAPGSKDFQQAVADAPTLLDYANNPSPGGLARVMGLAARVLADKTSPTRDDVSLGIMPGMPNPHGLPLTKVMTGDKPTRVYRGTPVDYAKEDPSRWDPNALYGPGAYFTENPSVASGYAESKGIGGFARITKYGPRGSESDLVQSQPNVRPANLDITNPFDINARLDDAAKAALRKAVGSADLPVGATSNALGAIDAGHDGATIYNTLSRAFGEKEKVNRVLQAAGYDGITHVGGANTGTAPHKVWIGFKPEQVVNPFEYESGLRRLFKK